METDKMNINIYYFSGTGNTSWVVQCLSNKLTELGNEVQALSCENLDLSTDDLDSVDIIGIAFPIYASFAPRNFQQFLLQLPKTTQKPLFAISTVGYIGGDVTWYTTEKLKEKGYIPFLFSNIIMGNNLHLPRLSPLPVTPYNKMKHRLKKAEDKITKLAQLINNKAIYKEGISVFGRLFGITQRAIAAKFESSAFKGFYVDKSCTDCGLCIKNCPINNIIVKENKITFLENCILCTRCYNFCPAKSIQCTEKTENLEKYVRYQGPEGKRYSSL